MVQVSVNDIELDGDQWPVTTGIWSEVGLRRLVFEIVCLCASLVEKPNMRVELDSHPTEGLFKYNCSTVVSKYLAMQGALGLCSLRHRLVLHPRDAQ